MTVHYELPTAADFTILAGEHHPAVTVYTSTSPVVSERERAEVAVKSGFDEALEHLKQAGAEASELDAIRAERDRILLDGTLWGGLARSLAIFVSPDVSEVFVLPNRLDDAVHVGSHFTLGQLLRAPSQDQEAFAVTISASEWAAWHATPTDRAAKLDVDQTGAANLDEATNREPNEDQPRGSNRGTATQHGGSSRLIGDEGRKTLLDQYSKRVIEIARRELLALDPEERVPVFVFAAEPLLSLFLANTRNSRRVVAVPGSPDRIGAAELDEAIRRELARLNVREAESALRALGEASAGRVERDLAAIARLAADGAVETFWFDFTTSVNGTLDRESGAIEFAVDHGSGDQLADGTRAGDLLPQIALLVLAKGGGVVTVRANELDGGVWTGPAMAELRFALT